MRTVSLSALTVLPCSPLEQIEAAAETGFDTVSLRIFPVMDTDVAVLADPALMGMIERRLDETGIKVFDVEVVRVSSSTNVAELSRALDFAAAVGAQRLAVTSGSREEFATESMPRLIDTFGELCGAAAERGVGVMLEFIPYRGIDTLDHAVQVVRAVDHPGLAVTVDALHFFRSGGRVEALSHVDAALLACAQLCDAPATPPADLPTEARYGRLYPGDGGLPLVDFLRALPEDLPIGVEIPCPASGASVVERAGRAAASIQHVLANAASSR